MMTNNSIKTMKKTDNNIIMCLSLLLQYFNGNHQIILLNQIPHKNASFYIIFTVLCYLDIRNLFVFMTLPLTVTIA